MAEKMEEKMNKKIIDFISEINVISKSLGEKINKLKEQAVSDVYIDELTETLKDLNKISNDTSIILNQDDLTNIRGAIDSKIKDNNDKLSAEDKDNIMKKVDEIITNMKTKAPNGGKGKTRKQRKHKKHRKQRKSKKHI